MVKVWATIELPLGDTNTKEIFLNRDSRIACRNQKQHFAESRGAINYSQGVKVKAQQLCAF